LIGHFFSSCPQPWKSIIQSRMGDLCTICELDHTLRIDRALIRILDNILVLSWTECYTWQPRVDLVPRLLIPFLKRNTNWSEQNDQWMHLYHLWRYSINYSFWCSAIVLRIIFCWLLVSICNSHLLSYPFTWRRSWLLFTITLRVPMIYKDLLLWLFSRSTSYHPTECIFLCSLRVIPVQIISTRAFLWIVNW